MQQRVAGVILVVSAILVIAIITGLGDWEKPANLSRDGDSVVKPVNTWHDAPPYAGFTCTPSSGAAPLTILCNASASWGGYSSIDTYGWDFGDGSQLQGADATIEHTYTSPGTYRILLFVHEPGGLGSTANQDIVVFGNAAPIR